MDYGYDKMISFANKIDLPYILVNTENMNEFEVFKYCSDIIFKYLSDDISDKKALCKYYNDLFYNNNSNPKILSLKKINI